MLVDVNTATVVTNLNVELRKPQRSQLFIHGNQDQHLDKDNSGNRGKQV
jgi:hypothetical protein